MLLTFSSNSDSIMEPDPNSATCLSPSLAYSPSAHMVTFLEWVQPTISLKWVNCKADGKYLGWVSFDHNPSNINCKKMVDLFLVPTEPLLMHRVTNIVQNFAYCVCSVIASAAFIARLTTRYLVLFP